MGVNNFGQSLLMVMAVVMLILQFIRDRLCCCEHFRERKMCYHFYFSRNGGQLGNSGSLQFLFDQKSVFLTDHLSSRRPYHRIKTTVVY